MNKTMAKLCSIFMITLLSSIYIVVSDTITVNSTENTENDNSTNDYDYNDVNDLQTNNGVKNDDDNKLSFVDKVIALHNEGKNATFVKIVENLNETFNHIRIAEKNIKYLFEPNEGEKQKFLKFLSKIDTGLSDSCNAALTRISIGVTKQDIWALKFLDSMGRYPPPGFIEGVHSSFGEYDECLDITSPYMGKKAQMIKGQYCMMKVIAPYPSLDNYKEGETTLGPMDFPSSYLSKFSIGSHKEGEPAKNFTEFPLSKKVSSPKGLVEGLNLFSGIIYRLGICIPSVCSANEVEYMINKILYPITRMPLEIGPKCHIKDEVIKLDNFQLTSITILSILTILVILSTGFDIYEKRSKLLEINEKISEKSPEIKNLFRSFSIIKNTRSLFEKNTKFAALDTFRLLFIINVHISHQYSSTITLGGMAVKKVLSEVLYLIFEDNRFIVVRNSLIMDVLFVLSGFLLSFGLLRKLEKTKGRLNYIMFILERWIKLLILLFGSIIFFYLYPLFGDGPIWDAGLEWVTPGCKDPTVLLKNFFFVNNFRAMHREELANAHSQCNPVSWFLGALLQLTILGLPFIVLYYKKPTLGLIATISAIFVSLLATIAPMILFGIRPYLQIWELDSAVLIVSDSFKWYHNTPNVYALSFFVGIAFGYLMSKEVSLTRIQENMIWILSIVMVTTVYFWNNSFWRLDKSAPLFSILLWTSMGKLFFSIGFAWIYYACCSGRGGYLNRILSWHGFQPIARLSFGIYILHFLVINQRVFSVKYTFVINNKLMMEQVVIDVIISTILAFIFYILIQCPFTNIFDALLTRKPVIKSDHLNNNKQILKISA